MCLLLKRVPVRVRVGVQEGGELEDRHVVCVWLYCTIDSPFVVVVVNEPCVCCVVCVCVLLQVGVYGRLLDDRGREHARRLEHFVAAQVGLGLGLCVCVCVCVCLCERGRGGRGCGLGLGLPWGVLRGVQTQGHLCVCIYMCVHYVKPTQEGRKALCAQNFYEPHVGDFWRGFPLYNFEEYRYLRCVRGVRE